MSIDIQEARFSGLFLWQVAQGGQAISWYPALSWYFSSMYQDFRPCSGKSTKGSRKNAVNRSIYAICEAAGEGEKYADGGGLHFRVEPTGSKLWRMQYTFLNKQKTLSFGKYAIISLSEARQKRDEGKKLMAYLHTRPGGWRLAEWSELNFGAAIWMIPGSRMKMRREHRKPLPRQAVELFRAQKELTGDGRYVFPSIKS
ncbi:integrase family protein [Xaviernesmea oryzae]|uniref:integrase family protein n=1 Tax=Xaviernesmea oryzae TaxID=464029 RepID=UPI00190ED9F8|nr:integrase family protein [Xaviernesmea oryzae]